MTSAEDIVLSDETVIRALVSALCQVYSGTVEVGVDGIPLAIHVEPRGISIRGYEEATFGIPVVTDL
jgi:hypothetical protein